MARCSFAVACSMASVPGAIISVSTSLVLAICCARPCLAWSPRCPRYKRSANVCAHVCQWGGAFVKKPMPTRQVCRVGIGFFLFVLPLHIFMLSMMRLIAPAFPFTYSCACPPLRARKSLSCVSLPITASNVRGSVISNPPCAAINSCAS